jgi:hypothetical protein
VFPEDQYEFYCDRCDSHVNESSKHCRRCNRCTAEFDHHCIWLNNCIGVRNYRVFFVLIVSFSLHLITTAATHLYIIVKSLYDITWPLYVSAILSIVFSLPVTYLVGYHVWLWKNNMSTYAHIQLKKQAKDQALNRPISKQMQLKSFITSCSMKDEPSSSTVTRPVSGLPRENPGQAETRA